MNHHSNSFSNDTTVAWVLNDEDWSRASRAWMDEELALHQQQQQQPKVGAGALTIIGISEKPFDQTLSKTDSEGSYQRKFGQKRRPSLNGGRRNMYMYKTVRNSVPNNHNDDENDDDNNTISTLSTTSLLQDSRDATASPNTICGDEFCRSDFSNTHWEEERAGEEMDRVVENMLYKCNITVVEYPPPLLIERISLPQRPKSINHTTSEFPVQAQAAHVTTMLAPPKIRKNRSMTTGIKSKSNSTKLRKNRTKKTVTFHKYDQLIHSSNRMEYVCSLYTSEVEREKEEYDVVDEIETAVSDVGYFFQCLQRSISEDVSTKFGRSKRKKYR
jgi:hypothetical protein